MNEFRKDIFAECLVKPQKTSSTIRLIISVWLVFIMLAAGLIILSTISPIASIFLIPASLVCLYIPYNLTVKLNAEFEYINTNGEIDIDRIINGKKRQTMASFECNSIEKIEKYNKTLHKVNKEKRIYHACTPSDNSFAFTVRHPRGGVYTVVMTPNEEFKESIKKYLPFTLKNQL